MKSNTLTDAQLVDWFDASIRYVDACPMYDDDEREVAIANLMREKFATLRRIARGQK